MDSSWKTCKVCSHNKVCAIMQDEESTCKYFKYDAQPIRYCDFSHLAAPLYEWLKYHYPNDVKILIDKNSARLLLDYKLYLKEEYSA